MVDDEPDVLVIVKTMLEAKGIEVLTAANAQDALSLVARQPREIALVLSDVRMPGKSGPQLVREVRELSPSTAVALMSAEPGQEAIDPRIPFIQKPFRLNVLIEMIRELLARQKRLAIDTQTHVENAVHLAIEIQAVSDESVELARESAELMSGSNKKASIEKETSAGT